MRASSYVVQGDTFDSIFETVLLELNEDPHHVCSPRGSKIKENIGMTLVLENPRARLLSSKTRDTNYGFAVGEFLWYWQGKRDLATMKYYNKRMTNFSDDGITLNSAYGYRLRKRYFFPHETAPGQGMTQWEVTKRTLTEDPDSRRAVMLINQPEDEVGAWVHGSKDVPCTLSLQFFIRDNKLDLHAHMRSNDVMWGLTYDLFSFTLMQECMLLDLKTNEKFKDLQLGKYIHTAGSMHLYETHFEQAKKIVEEYSQLDLDRPPQEALVGLGELEIVCNAETDIRRVGSPLHVTSGLSNTAAWMVEELVKHRQKRDAEQVEKK